MTTSLRAGDVVAERASLRHQALSSPPPHTKHCSLALPLPSRLSLWLAWREGVLVEMNLVPSVVEKRAKNIRQPHFSSSQPDDREKVPLPWHQGSSIYGIWTSKATVMTWWQQELGFGV